MEPHAPPFTVDTDSGALKFPEVNGNEIQLAVAVRKFTDAKPTISGAQRWVKCEPLRLYDSLGLFRALQHDVKLYNEAMSSKAPAVEKDHMEARTLRRYQSYRLRQLANSFGVRLPRAGKGRVEVAGLDALVAHLEERFADKIAAARASLDDGSCDFDDLAELFRPGQGIVDNGIGTGLDGLPTGYVARACYFKRTRTLFGEGRTFYAALECVVSVGETLALLEHTHLVGEYAGSRSVAWPSPAEFAPVPDAVRADLLARGRLYERVATQPALMDAAASAFTPISPHASASHGTLAARAMAGRFMADTSAALGRGVHVGRLPGLAAEAVAGALKSVKHASRNPGSSAAAAGQDDDGGDVEGLLLMEAPLPEDLAWRTWPSVAGFSFASKCWGLAALAGLQSATFDRRVFEGLVLPDSRKRLIEALVIHTHERAGDEGRADLVAGKGAGAIFLLHGPPGVGKTLTAEAIAELLERPLYQVCARKGRPPPSFPPGGGGRLRCRRGVTVISPARTRPKPR